MISKIILNKKVKNRDDILIRLTKGKTVVHFGCIDDNLKLIKDKLKNGQYLHQKISESAKKCYGIDINRKLFRELEKLGFGNIFFGDIQTPSSYEISLSVLRKAEVVLIPDTIEHLPNPGMAIEGLGKTFRKGSKVLITTPNPFMWAHFFTTMFRYEIFSPYHLSAFSAMNIKNLLKKYKISIKEIHPYWYPKEGGLGKRLVDRTFAKLFTKMSPLFSDGFVYECVIK